MEASSFRFATVFRAKAGVGAVDRLIIADPATLDVDTVVGGTEISIVTIVGVMAGE
jgi:hypothetical protein